MGWGSSTTTAITPAWGADTIQQSKGAEHWNTGVTSGVGVTDEWVEKTVDSTTDQFNSQLKFSDHRQDPGACEDDAWGGGHDNGDSRRDLSNMKCYNCQGMGHGSRTCPESPREREVRPFFDWSHHPELESEDAWSRLKAADAEKDLDDIKECFEIYAKNTPEATFQTIEKRFRAENMNTRLVCLEKEIPLNKTNVNLQQEPDKKYVVGFQLSKRSRRTKMIEGMLADSYEDNFERLADCGFTTAARVPVCFNCNQKGHVGKDCPEGQVAPEDRDMSHIVKVVCSNCEEEGHRLRNCPAPRKAYSKGCRNCGDEGHMVADCDQPRRPKDGESCFNCGSIEHYGKDCSEPRKPREDTRECYNCLQTGHIGRDCPEPRKPREDTRECHNCLQTGHIGRNCPEPRKSRDNRGMPSGGANIDHYASAKQEMDNAAGGFNDVPSWDPNADTPCWQVPEPQASVTAGGW